MDMQHLRAGITQAEATAIQGMLRSKGFEATVSKEPNPNFRIKNPYRFSVMVHEKEMDRAGKIIRTFDEKTLRHHVSIIVLRSGDMGEVPAIRIAKCPLCSGPATDPPGIGGVSHWMLMFPAMLIGGSSMWLVHPPVFREASSYIMSGVVFFICGAVAHIVLMLLLGRKSAPLNIRHCVKCNQNWDLEDYLIEGGSKT